MAESYDVIVIGTGAGGGTLAHTLATAGRKVLMLERGNFLPRETENWEPEAVFVDGRYISPDTWYDADGHPFQPQVHYFVGGATKLYGAALYRLRPQDFEELKHVDGVSPAWPISYADLEPYYTKAEWLYQVHGEHGTDPTEGSWSKQYPWPAVSHEPRIRGIVDAMTAAGYHPFPAPCGILLDEEDRSRSTCIRCTWCDGYPCLVHAKSDADTIAVRPVLDLPNVTLLVDAEVVRLETDATGRAVTDVVVNRDGVAGVRERQAPERSRERFGRGRTKLHVPQQQSRCRAGEGAQRHGLSEDARTERLLPRDRRVSVADGQHPDGRQVERAGDEG